jgi:hypothetical protein
MSYGIVLWGISTDNRKVFYFRNKIIIIIAGAKTKVSCEELFRKCNVRLLATEFILLVLSSVVDNMEQFYADSHVQDISA